MTAEARQSPHAPGLDDRPLRRKAVASVELDGEVVLLDEQGGGHLLNPTAGLLWSCFDGTGSLDEIAGDVADAFGLPVEAIRGEVLSLADDLVRRGVLLPDAAAEDDPPEAADAPEEPVIVQPGGY